MTSRRSFLLATGSATWAVPWLDLRASQASPEPIIDIHQHMDYKGRSVQQLMGHQRVMGVTTTVILPSARAFDRLPDGSRKDPRRAGTAGNQTAQQLARERPKEFVWFANELPTNEETLQTIHRHLHLGGRGIGELKFEMACDSPLIEQVAELAQSFDVPLLLHFQHGKYNKQFHRFHTVLSKYPKVSFIGHAQTWWGNIDRNHDQSVMYPKGKVSPGGITDRLLGEYPNMFGDLSAGSGNNALSRDPEHARGFLERHQDKLMFGSDCADSIGRGPRCTGSRTIDAIRQLSPSSQVARKILYQNAKKLLKL